MFGITFTKQQEPIKSEAQILIELERALEQQRITKDRELSAAESNAGDAALEGILGTDDAEPRFTDVAGGLAALRAEKDVLIQAIDSARRKRRDAIRRGFQAQAAELRAKADGLRRERGELLAKAEKLLGKLSELEGITYDRSILLFQRNGHWNPSVLTAPTDDLRDCGPNEAGANIPLEGWLKPKSRTLLEEIAAIERQAEAIERQEPMTEGVIEVETAEALIEALYADSSRMAPAERDVRAWLNEVERRVHDAYLRARKRQYRLVFRDDRIDRDESRLDVADVDGSLLRPIAFTPAGRMA